MYNIDYITKLADNYEQQCSLIIKEGRIEKLPNGKYRVLSEKGKNLGTSDSHSGAEKCLQQVEYFKHKDQHQAEDKKIIDLTKADEFAYSAIMRCLNQQASREQVLDFLRFFKKEFDKALKKKLQKPEKIALQNSLISFNKIHPIKLKRKLVKTAATSELGDPILVGKYLADIIKFTLNRISPERRPASLAKLRTKIYHLNEQQLASKVMPPSSSMGQSITFLKHVLFNHDAQYIREVLNNVTRNLI
jgi:hypothetical protein